MLDVHEKNEGGKYEEEVENHKKKHDAAVENAGLREEKRKVRLK